MVEVYSQERRPFRLHHLLLLLEAYEKQSFPLDSFLREHFRLHKAIGSKDRKWIAEKVYELVRWRGLVDALVEGTPTWEKRVNVLERLGDLSRRPLDSARGDGQLDARGEKLDTSKLPAHIQVSCPEVLFKLLVDAYGKDKASEFCRVSNERAPVTVRVNTLKVIREELMQEWSDQKYAFTVCEKSPNGLNVQTNMNFFALPEFKAGKFELQDEGSQLISDLVAASPNDWVLDYCAGAGGKSLAIAARMKNRGQLFLHDIRKSALLEAKKRMNRAGVQNAQFLDAGNDKKKNQLAHKMQWVLVDAPCSGTGTLRRNPDLKWRFRKEGLAELIALQAKIFSEAMAFVQPGGFIVYATCSVLPQENEEQAAFFMKTYKLVKSKEFHSLPESGKMDGFYGVVFMVPG